SRKVGLCAVIEGRPPARTIGSDSVVITADRPERAHGPDGDDLRLVTGTGDAAVYSPAVGVFPVVACGNDDDDSVLDGVPANRSEWIDFRRLVRLVAEREVQYADVQASAAGVGRVLVLNGPLNRCHDVARVAAAIVIEGAQVDQTHTRSDA